MKKIMTMMAVALCFIMSACSGSSNPEAVASKIEKGQALTEADYNTMIDYCGDYAEKAQKYFDIINAEPNDSTEAAINATNELANMYSSAKYLDVFRKAIFSADSKELGEKNEEKVNEFAKYEAFPIPGVSDSTMINPDVIGDIVDMPADSSTVIADGDGELVKAN